VLATVRRLPTGLARRRGGVATHARHRPRRRQRQRTTRYSCQSPACRGGASAQPALHRAGPVQRAVSRFPREVLCEGARRPDDAMAAAAPRWRCSRPDGTGRSALECAFISKGMYEEHLALQRERIAGDPERLAALEQGFAEAGYQARCGALRNPSRRATRSREASPTEGPGLASQPPGSSRRGTPTPATTALPSTGSRRDSRVAAATAGSPPILAGTLLRSDPRFKRSSPPGLPLGLPR